MVRLASPSLLGAHPSSFLQERQDAESALGSAWEGFAFVSLGQGLNEVEMGKGIVSLGWKGGKFSQRMSNQRLL